ncbi:MAG: TlpA family protein disulfide reductase [Sphingobacteriaceae bacterium]
MMKPKFLIISALILLCISLFIFLFNNPANRFRFQRLFVKGAGIFNEADSKKSTSQKPADEISFRSADGKFVGLHDLKGKTVFINFWATWCGPCIVEMPSINRLHQKLADNQEVVFLMVDVDGNVPRATAFMKKNQYGLPVYIPNSTIPETLLGRGIPVTVIFTPDGKMAYRHEGGNEYDTPGFIDMLTSSK